MNHSRPSAPFFAIYVACVLAPDVCLAQLPAGAIAGVVRDQAAGVMSGAQLRAVSLATRQVRMTATGEHGEYTFSALLPGEYDVSVEAVGFQRIVRAAIVEAGTTTRADFVLRLGDLSDSVTVEAASPQIRYDSASVSGVVTRDHINGLPLNGRSFLDLARLEPGLQFPTTANRNRTIVSVLGSPAPNVGGARFTMDGGSVTSVGLGGAQMSFSQESVQEFQVSTVNYSLSAGMTDVGSINVITRSGGNEPQGALFYYFRDHNLSAYPALTRDRSNPNPFFQRQQFGLALGGPVRKDRLFYFGSWERNDQRSVATTTLLAADFAHLSRVTASPLLGNLFSGRLDAKINSAHSIFLRHSQDGNRAFGPAAAITGGSPNAYPSNWNDVVTDADQSVIGVTSVFTSTLVNDLRISSFSIRSSMNGPGDRDCRGCLGLGAPSISIPQAGLVVGHSAATDNRARRFHLNQSITWQRGAHRARFGVDWEHNRDRNLFWSNEPVSITMFSPDLVRAYNALPGVSEERRIPLPAEFRTIDDVLHLPLHSITVGIGEPGVRQENGGLVRRWNTVWLYAEDLWQLRDRLTVTYGLGWGLDGSLNHDLQKPRLLEPILGVDGLGPTQKNWINFSPAAGVVWTPSEDSKTVVRASAGRYYRPHGLTGTMDAERVALGPPGNRQDFRGSSIPNPIPGLPGVPVGVPLDFRVFPTLFSGGHLIAALPDIRAALAKSLTSADATVQQIQITKQASPAIFPVKVPNPSGVHANLGLQRELVRGLVVSADVVFRHFVHAPQNGGALDVNHFDSIRGAAIPVCNPVQVNDPQALCSRGPINVQVVPYRLTYKGLLARAEKRLAKGFQALGSYAYSRSSAILPGNGFNLHNWVENRGPSGINHILNLAGVVKLPRQFDLGFNFSYASAPPFSPYVGGIDFNGDGTVGDLLPGTTVNAFNRGMDDDDLERLVTQFNDVHGGTRDAKGAPIPPLTLPRHYSLGDDFHSLDLRLSRSLTVHRHYRVSLIGEVFNAYNQANLAGHSEDLTSPSFGQPTSRATQVFGSGGARAFQIAVRMNF